MSRSPMDATRTGSLRRNVATLRETLASELWPLPTFAILAGVVLGIALPIADRSLDGHIPVGVASLLFGGGVDSARAVLGAIAGSLITATSLTFSLTVVALQLASSQFSPRVLRTFAKDRVVHATLAIFVGTFAYALTVLRTVQDATESTAQQVPRIAVTLASVLTIASVVTLTLFLAHLSRQLRVETTMRQVHAETSVTIQLVADTVPEGPASIPSDFRPPTSHLARATRSGFIRSVDRARLLRIATVADIVIEEEFAVGYNIVSGTPVARWWPRNPVEHLSSERVEDIERDVVASFPLAYERTSSQDIGFGVRQLADIVVRALSPGVNDPTTAVHGLGHLSAIMGELASLPRQPAALTDEHAAIRLVQRVHAFDALLETAIEQPRRYGAQDPDVAARLINVLREVAFRTTDPDYLATIASQLERLEASIAEATYDRVERDRFAALAELCREALQGQWPPGREPRPRV